MSTSRAQTTASESFAPGSGSRSICIPAFREGSWSGVHPRALRDGGALGNAGGRGRCSRARRCAEVGYRRAAHAKGIQTHGGPLAHKEADPGEREATSALFAGAVGVFKNTGSHRQVDYDDSTEAAEVVLFADLLMRILDQRDDGADD